MKNYIYKKGKDYLFNCENRTKVNITIEHEYLYEIIDNGLSLNNMSKYGIDYKGHEHLILWLEDNNHLKYFRFTFEQMNIICSMFDKLIEMLKGDIELKKYLYEKQFNTISKNMRKRFGFNFKNIEFKYSYFDLLLNIEPNVILMLKDGRCGVNKDNVLTMVKLMIGNSEKIFKLKNIYKI